jgi:SAM-dependent methyltransferase
VDLGFPPGDGTLLGARVEGNLGAVAGAAEMAVLDVDGDARIADRAWQVITAASMTAGRGPLARVVAEAAEPTPADRVVDIGCGPGTVVRYAARRAAAATGVDPDPAILRLARWSTRLRPAPSVTWLQGRPEKLPLPDGQATVAWAISSPHHWEDRGAAVTAACRVLAPGGHLVLAERLAEPGARGHAAQGRSRDQAGDLAAS